MKFLIRNYFANRMLFQSKNNSKCLVVCIFDKENLGITERESYKVHTELFRSSEGLVVCQPLNDWLNLSVVCA